MKKTQQLWLFLGLAIILSTLTIIVSSNKNVVKIKDDSLSESSIANTDIINSLTSALAKEGEWSIQKNIDWNNYNFRKPINGDVAKIEIALIGGDSDNIDILSIPLINRLGFKDSSIAASRPGASKMGYIRSLHGSQNSQLIIVSQELIPKEIQSLTPDGGGVKFICPCKEKVEIFVSSPISEADLEYNQI